MGITWVWPRGGMEDSPLYGSGRFHAKFPVSTVSQRSIFLRHQKMHERGWHAQNGTASGGEAKVTSAFCPSRTQAIFPKNGSPNRGTCSLLVSRCYTVPFYLRARQELQQQNPKPMRMSLCICCHELENDGNKNLSQAVM